MQSLRRRCRERSSTLTMKIRLRLDAAFPLACLTLSIVSAITLLCLVQGLSIRAEYHPAWNRAGDLLWKQCKGTQEAIIVNTLVAKEPVSAVNRTVVSEIAPIQRRMKRPQETANMWQGVAIKRCQQMRNGVYCAREVGFPMPLLVVFYRLDGISGSAPVCRWVGMSYGNMSVAPIACSPVLFGAFVDLSCSIVLSAVSLKVFAFVKHRYRRWSGHCVKCGYSIADDIQVCPECGNANR